MSTRADGAVTMAGLAAALGARLLAVSQRLAVAAAGADWAAVAALLAEREPLTRALGGLDPAHLDAPTRARLRAAITLALTLDRRVQAEARLCQEALRVEMRRSRQGRRALGAYAAPTEPDEARALDRAG